MKTTEERIKFFNKNMEYLISISKAEKYDLHTNQINIYYLPSVYPTTTKATLSGLSLYPNHEHPNSLLSNLVDVIRNKGRSGILFMQHKTQGNRGRVVAHELGHMLGLRHEGRPGKQLMSQKCTYKGNSLSCGKKISEVVANQARNYYYKYYQKLL